VQASGYESNWKTPISWIVRRGFGTDLLAGRQMTFEGGGDGKATSVVKLDGVEWGRGCVYNSATDMVTFEVNGLKYNVTRQGQTAPVSLSGVAASMSSVNSGGSSSSVGSWTAEEGNTGIGPGPGGGEQTIQTIPKPVVLAG
jgi:hypothetical protein